MSILAECVDVVIGIDTHKQTHTAAIVTAGSGAHETTLTVPATPSGFEQLLIEASRHGALRCWAIEGCGSWGHSLVRWLHEHDERVVEVDRPKRPNQPRDPTLRQVLHLPRTLPTPRKTTGQPIGASTLGDRRVG
jgi:transposase